MSHRYFILALRAPAAVLLEYFCVVLNMNMACACFLLIDVSHPTWPQLREISNLIQDVKKLCIDRGEGIGLYHSSLVEFLNPSLYAGDDPFHTSIRLFFQSINPEF